MPNRTDHDPYSFTATQATGYRSIICKFTGSKHCQNCGPQAPLAPSFHWTHTKITATPTNTQPVTPSPTRSIYFKKTKHLPVKGTLSELERTSSLTGTISESRVPGEVPGKVVKYSEGKVIYRAQSIKSPNHFNKQLTFKFPSYFQAPHCLKEIRKNRT